MRMKHSQIALVIGLGVGLLALWGGAAPIGVNGDLVTGAWGQYYFWAWEGEYEYLVICSRSYCLEHMDAQPVWLDCSDGPNAPWGNCKGGSFIGAAWNGGAGRPYEKSRLVRAAIRWPRRSHCCLTFSSGLPMDNGP
jgi:hypothetical protein